MAGKEKVIAVVGVSEQDTAHLRLLLRKAQEQLKFSWRWGGEDGADLVLIDPKTFAGKLARNRFGATGARCVLLLDPDAVEENATLLRRPFKVNEFMRVLAQVEGGVLEGLDLVPISDDFYFGDNAEFGSEHSLDELDSEEIGTAAVIRNSGDADFDAMEDTFKHDPADDTPRFSVPINLGRDTAIEATGDPTSRSDRRRSELGKAAKPGMRIDPDAVPPFKRVLEDSAVPSEPLLAFLTRKLLGGPARVTFDGAPSLVLDPKNYCFHSRGSLKELEAYCLAPIMRNAWHVLTTTEVAQLRETEPARPYEQLHWLDALIRSGGRLSSHLDPGGSYRLTRAIDLGADYQDCANVARAMVLPLRLHEIAAAAQVEMGQVFDTVNAYDAIGCIEWSPRQPRHAAPAEEGARGKLLGKLKLPFGRK